MIFFFTGNQLIGFPYLRDYEVIKVSISIIPANQTSLSDFLANSSRSSQDTGICDARAEKYSPTKISLSQP